MLFLPLFFLGISLAYYLPSVPFILWTMAVIGWLILVAETLVAAPLWAAAHALPEGEGIAGQRGSQGYMLFLGVLFRPALMVAGFFISFILFQSIGMLIGQGFKVFFAGMSVGHIQGLTTFIAMVFLIGGIILVAAHKLFHLITWMPDNVLRWVGQNVQNLGEKEDEGRTRTIFGLASTKGEGAASGAFRPKVQNKPGDGGEEEATSGEKRGSKVTQNLSQVDHGDN